MSRIEQQPSKEGSFLKDQPYMAKIEASNQFYLSNLDLVHEKYACEKISANDNVKKTRGDSKRQEVAQMKEELRELLRKETQTYYDKNTEDFESKKQDQIREYIQCQTEIIKEADNLIKREENLAKNAQSLSDKLDTIARIEKLKQEANTLREFLEKVEIEKQGAKRLLHRHQEF